MVVFGAGASYDSYSTVPPGAPLPNALRERPVEQMRFPLAKDLFDVRGEFLAMTDRFPAVKPLLPYLRRPPNGETLEEFLARLQEKARPQRLGQLTAMRFYLQSAISVCENQWRRTLLHEETNQLALLEQIEDWRHSHAKEVVWLVTFNYDTMLEAALPPYIGRELTSLEDYIRPESRYKLVKLHGSIHWFREIDNGPSTGGMSDDEGAATIVRAASDLRISQRYFCEPNRRPAVTYRFDKPEVPLYPAVAIPVVAKQAFECPPDHLEALTRALQNVDYLFLIGWRGAEESFLELLRTGMKRAIKGLVVAATVEEAREIRRKVLPALPPRSELSPHAGFTSTLLAHEFGHFLNSTS